MIWINPYSPVESAADLPKFCGVCGRPMRDDTHKGGHNRTTGESWYWVAVRCPRGRRDNGHEAYIVSARPSLSPLPPPAAQTRS